MNIEIRKASIDDIDLLVEWRIRVLREVFEIPENQPTEEFEYANRLYYQSELETGGHIACFAYSGDEIIGCGGVCLHREMPSPDNLSGKCAYLMNIYTAPKFRSFGAGEKVVRWLIGQARSKGITKIYLETSDIGRRLYEKVGFEDMGYMMILKNKI
ncbi:MAG: GNAT family N-acetyltransferase [Ruminococcus sp.]|nr:GNAT family N-acetyltransferase [Ruminococcus sp.]